jgi:hypothetical protein
MGVYHAKPDVSSKEYCNIHQVFFRIRVMTRLILSSISLWRIYMKTNLIPLNPQSLEVVEKALILRSLDEENPEYEDIRQDLLLILFAAENLEKESARHLPEPISVDVNKQVKEYFLRKEEELYENGQIFEKYRENEYYNIWDRSI